LLKAYGRHGSVREVKAVGRRWTKAVAIRTPVPKCWQMKRMVRWRRPPFVRRWENRGKAQAVVHRSQHLEPPWIEAEAGDVPKVLRMRIRKRAKTWMPVSYAPLLLEPHAGRSSVSSRLDSSARSSSVGIEDHERSA
jgi:hypothetical protein